MPAGCKVYVGVHASSAPPAGPLIALATQAALPGGWVISPLAVATHAYLVAEHVDGTRWRLDGMPPRARWSPAGGLVAGGLPAAVWQLVVPSAQVSAVFQRARELDAATYDWAEILAQGAVAAGAMVRGLGWGGRLRALGGAPWARDAAICTRVVVEALRPALALDLPDLFPERLASVLRGLEGTPGTVVRVI